MCTYISAMVMVTSLFSNRRWNSPLWCGMVYMAKCQNSTRENSSIRSIRTKAYGLATQTTPMCLVFMTPKFKLWIDSILQCVAMFRNNNIQWMEKKTSTLPYSPSLIECACFRPKLWFISVIRCFCKLCSCWNRTPHSWEGTHMPALESSFPEHSRRWKSFNRNPF